MCLARCGFVVFLFSLSAAPRDLHSFPTRRSSDLEVRLAVVEPAAARHGGDVRRPERRRHDALIGGRVVGEDARSEEHTSELQSHSDLVCRLLLEKKKTKRNEN